MFRRPLFQWQAFQLLIMRLGVLSGISLLFKRLSQAGRQVVYVLLTRAPLYSPSEEDFLVRLACVKHAASVRSEPGSNSRVEIHRQPLTNTTRLGTALTSTIPIGKLPLAELSTSFWKRNLIPPKTQKPNHSKLSTSII